MLCPAFTVGHNLKNVSLQIFVQLYLMNRLDDINKLQTILNSDDKTTALKKFLDELYAVFSRIAEIVPHKAPENTTQEEDDEKAIEAKQSALKKLKKQIHFFAELNGVDLKNNASTRIVNFQKLRERFERDQVRLQELYRLEEMTKKDNIELSSLIQRMKEDRRLLKNLNVTHKNLLLDETLQKDVIKKRYAVVDNITPITTPEYRAHRKKIKSRMNTASFVISLIVGLGEGLIAAVFMMTILPALPALLLFGLPGFTCNYYLFRGASYSVMKEIYFGQSSDTALTKQCKKISTLCSFAAGISFGFLSFGSATVGIGHILLMLGIGAAIATPVGLAVAAVIAIVTAVAFGFLFDCSIRKMMGNDVAKKIQDVKESVKKFFRRDIKSVVGDIVAITMAFVLTSIILIVTAGVLRHRGAEIFTGIMKIPGYIASKLSIVNVAMGSLPNAIFFSRTISTAVIAIKEAVLHPVRTWHAVKEGCRQFFDKENLHRRAAHWITAVKRFFLGTCVVLNGVGEAHGYANSPAAKKDMPVGKGWIFTSETAASDSANAIAVLEATAPTPMIVSKAEMFATRPEKKVEVVASETSALKRLYRFFSSPCSFPHEDLPHARTLLSTPVM